MSASGRKTYWLRYTDQRRRRRETKIGRYGDITVDQARKRALALKAIVALGGDPAGDRDRPRAIALLALTGARTMEILGARWIHVDFNRNLLTVPLAKSGRRRHVTLSAAALAVLRLQPRAPGQEFVFPSARRPGRSIVAVRTVWDRAKAAADLPAGCRLHDLRHTYASLCVNRGIPLYDVSKLLGHAKQATTTHYAHLRDDRLLEAADTVGSIATRVIAA
jgi:integrase